MVEKDLYTWDGGTLRFDNADRTIRITASLSDSDFVPSIEEWIASWNKVLGVLVEANMSKGSPLW